MELNKIKEILGKIKDPDLGVTLDELEAITSLSMDSNKITLHLTLPSPITYLKKDYEKILNKVLSEAGMTLDLDLIISEQESTNIRTVEPKEEEDPERKHRHKNIIKINTKIKHVIAISSGKGGVGKSTISANIAAELAAQGAKVGILDADIYGPSQTIMFGLTGEVMEASTDQHGNTVAYPVERYGVKVASVGFVINRDEAAALRGPMLSRIFNMFYEQIDWGELDYLVFDLPPGTGDIHLSFAKQTNPDGIVLVTTPQEISVADVRRGAKLFNRLGTEILGVVENMSYFVPPDMPDKKYYIFGEAGGKNIALELGVLLLGEVPFSVMMRETSDAGKPIVLREDGSYQKEVLKDITANIVSELRRKLYNKKLKNYIII